MPVPACIACGRFFRCLKTGGEIMECMPIDRGASPGKNYAALWEDYKLWHCDLWHCQGCGTVIAVGYGHDPLSEHYEPEFNDQRERATERMGGAIPRIYDC